ncbi:MAG: tripartite tricarboxylate transporter substrate binding protein [Burkholderiales bacterium]|nr:tripartite tricarboxylate transporter substrate binding protein [Burkholderiales bacterium]
MVSRREFTGAALLAALPVPHAARAQAWPDRPLRMIIPFPPGGPVDAGGRLIAGALGEVLGQPVVIETRTGAGGSVGVEAAAKAAPDGHTLVFATTGALAVNVTLVPNLGYDTRRDLVPISVTLGVPLLMACREGLPAQDIAAVLAMARAKPGGLTMATSGVGGPPHLLTEMMRQRAGLDFTVVHYRGAAPAMVAMLANEVDVSILDPAVMMPHIKAGKMRALATTSRARNPAMPNIPSLVEAGLRGIEFENWYALMAPAATPPERVRRLREALTRAVAKPGLFDLFLNQGGRVMDLGPEEGAAFIRREIDTWGEVVRTARMTAQ